MLLNVKKLQVYYGKALALEEVNLELVAGTLLAVVGPNGAGKTTLLKAINGIEKPTRGCVYFNGEDITNIATHKLAWKGLIHCPEGRRPFPELTVLENLKVGGLLLKSKKLVKKRLEYVYELFPILREREDQLVGNMSGGQQQMVAIGRALMADPKLLMLDEPSLGLAPKVVEEIFDRIKIIKQAGTSILLVEQNVDVALSVADRIYILDHGKMVYSGSADEVFQNNQLKEVYLGI